MSGLRCWPGCLAVVGGPGFSVNTGKTVTCLRLATPRELDAVGYDPSAPTWMVDRPLQTLWGFAAPYIRDARLTPITPPPGTDCSTTDTDKPVEVSA